MARANLRSKDTVQMVNPWSGALPPDMCWTWRRVRDWCRHNVHPSDQKDFMKEAREAFADDDGKTLGEMIIGS